MIFCIENINSYLQLMRQYSKAIHHITEEEFKVILKRGSSMQGYEIPCLLQLFFLFFRGKLFQMQ